MSNMKEYYLADGCNIINFWQDFAGMREKDLEHLRRSKWHYKDT